MRRYGKLLPLISLYPSGLQVALASGVPVSTADGVPTVPGTAAVPGTPGVGGADTSMVGAAVLGPAMMMVVDLKREYSVRRMWCYSTVVIGYLCDFFSRSASSRRIFAHSVLNPGRISVMTPQSTS